MNTTTQKSLIAAALVLSAPLAAAHNASDTHGVSLFHYLSSPDHVALFGLVAVIGLALTIVARRRAVINKRD